MAAYFEYRHVELNNVGYGKKRVLKPPGGGSSDIFGPAGDDRPRQVRQNLHASSLGGGFFNGNSAGDQQDSAGIQQQQQQQSLSNGSSAPDTPRSNKPDGNPVTGAGYDGSQHNGGGSAGSSSAGSEKSSTDSSPSVGSVPRLKNRVPPGGFSSGLW